MEISKEELQAAVALGARNLFEQERFCRLYPDVVKDRELLKEAKSLEPQIRERHPEWDDRTVLETVGDIIRRGYGSDADRAEAVGREKLRRRRNEQANADQDADSNSESFGHRATLDDALIADADSEHEAICAEGIAQLRKSRGPRPGPDAEARARFSAAVDQRRRSGG